MIDFAPFCAIWPVVFSLACAGSIPAVQAESDLQPPRACGDDSALVTSDSMPRYFTLQLSPDQLADGRVMVDGGLLPESELDDRLQKEVQNDELRGAALLVAPGVADPDVLRLFRQLRLAGFTHVLVSGAHSPVSDASVAERSEESPAAVTVPGPAADPTPEPEPEGPPSDVVVKNLGLHIGGGPNSEENKERYSAPIAKRFDDFRRCHLFAKERELNASFGVDLLVGASGGRAKIKDYRTSLKGKDFHLCVLGVFGEIQFPAPPRPTVVSYSLLFKKP